MASNRHFCLTPVYGSVMQVTSFEFLPDLGRARPALIFLETRNMSSSKQPIRRNAEALWEDFSHPIEFMKPPGRQFLWRRAATRRAKAAIGWRRLG